MKLSHFGHKGLRNTFERLVKFRPKDNPFMSYIFRLFKELKIIFPIFFLGILFLNLATPKTNFKIAAENILLNKNDQGSKKILVEEFIKNNDFDNALKLDQGEVGKISKLKNQPLEIRQEINFWKNTTDLYPNYRDAYIKLAFLNYNLFNNYLAKLYLEKAREIDPTLSLELPH